MKALSDLYEKPSANNKPQAREKAEKEGFEIGVVKTSFKENTKALAENEAEGLAKLIYRADSGEILGVHICGMHAADLIHDASIAIAMGTPIQDMKYAVHAHPTLSEVMDELLKSAKVSDISRSDPKLRSSLILSWFAFQVQSLHQLLSKPSKFVNIFVRKVLIPVTCLVLEGLCYWSVY